MVKHPHIAIAGIHTDIGKTIVSAVLAAAMHADYWKPVQAGNLDDSDSLKVRQWVSHPQTRVHPEGIQLQQAASPHAAAAAEQLTYNCLQLRFPQTTNTLIIETAGGLLSPMDPEHTVADFLAHHQLPTLLVSRTYLGSINHTLLSIEVMRQRGIPILGILFNGAPDEASSTFIEQYTGITDLWWLPELEVLQPESIAAAALQFRKQYL